MEINEASAIWETYKGRRPSDEQKNALKTLLSAQIIPNNVPRSLFREFATQTPQSAPRISRNETQINRDAKKQDNFRRLANYRTSQVLDALRKIGNLSNRSAYSWNESDVAAIFTAIEQELMATQARFTPNRRKEFRLS